MPDLQVESYGSVYLFRPLTDVGREWLESNTDGMWYGGALAVEHRFAWDLEKGALNDGLNVAPPA